MRSLGALFGNDATAAVLDVLFKWGGIQKPGFIQRAAGIRKWKQVEGVLRNIAKYEIITWAGRNYDVVELNMSSPLVPPLRALWRALQEESQ